MQIFFGLIFVYLFSTSLVTCRAVDKSSFLQIAMEKSENHKVPLFNLLTADVKLLQGLLSNGTFQSTELVREYVAHIEKYNHYFHAVISITPQDILDKAAKNLDQERQAGKIRGPLHGIPILIKDNIATHPSLGLRTTAGSFALYDSKPAKNAKLIDQLINAGAIILGKANLSELSNWKGLQISSGWSAVGGQTQSAYVKGGVRDDDGTDGHSNPSGSSSGSAVAVSAGFSPVSIGTETDGSLMAPAARAALYTIKPTIGIVSQDGIVPVSPNFDSAGPFSKTPYDLAVVLDAITDRESPSRKGKTFVDALTGSWADLRIGTLDPEIWKFPESFTTPRDGVTEQIAIADHKLAMNKYLSGLKESTVRTLEELVQFNKDHADKELPEGKSNQAILDMSQASNITSEEYDKLFKQMRSIARDQGIDKVFKEYNLDVIIGPGDSMLFSIAAATGYPIAAMPLSTLDYNGRPFGMAAIARAHEDMTLVKVMHAWYTTFGERKVPDLDAVIASSQS